MVNSVPFWFIFAVAVAGLWPVHAAGPAEHDVKAAFLFNFAKFVEWPPDAFANPESPIVIGILGQTLIADSLEEVVRGKAINGRPLLVRRFGSWEDFGGAHILFVSPAEARRVPGIVERLQDRPVLTVGDAEGFARQGGVINFVIEQNRVRFQINVDAARRADLKLHSTLLNLARIVRDEQ